MKKGKAVKVWIARNEGNEWEGGHISIHGSEPHRHGIVKEVWSSETLTDLGLRFGRCRAFYLVPAPKARRKIKWREYEMDGYKVLITKPLTIRAARKKAGRAR